MIGTRTRAARARSHPRPPNDAGYSLVEMVVAMGIVMLIIASTLGLFISAQHSQRTAEARDRATQIANDRIEQIRVLEWTKVGFDNITYTGATTSLTNDANVTYATYAPASETPVKYNTIDLALEDSKRVYPIIAKDDRTLNSFTVLTYITWASALNGGAAPQATNDTRAATDGRASRLYGYKRVRVVVAYRLDGSLRTVTNETLIAPSPTDELPPGIPLT